MAEGAMLHLDPDYYREQVHRAVMHVCVDQGVPADAPGATCRIDHLLPELVEAARQAGPDDYAAFRLAYRLIACRACERQGGCTPIERWHCCPERFLPLIYDAICAIDHEDAKVARLTSL